MVLVLVGIAKMQLCQLSHVVFRVRFGGYKCVSYSNPIR